MCFFNESLGLSVLGDGLGALGHGMLGELTREAEPDSCLNLAGGNSAPLVGTRKNPSLSSETIKDILGHVLENGHSLGGNTSIGVDLLENLVNVSSVGLLPQSAVRPLSIGVSSRSLGHVDFLIS